MKRCRGMVMGVLLGLVVVIERMVAMTAFLVCLPFLSAVIALSAPSFSSLAEIGRRWARANDERKARAVAMSGLPLDVYLSLLGLTGMSLYLAASLQLLAGGIR